jgi:DNA-binding MarR family transcriptional regulator
MVTRADVAAVQRCYPQIYLACHTRPKRARTSKTHISPRDSSLLAHLHHERAVSPASLARHLDIGAPTLSAALKRLAALGYVALSRAPHDSRRQEVRLTSSGAAAMREASVLDATRVARILSVLSPTERRRAIAGLELLARASRRANNGR